MPVSRAPWRDRLMDSFQGRMTGSNPRKRFPARNENLQVPPNVETLVGGIHAPAEGIKLWGVSMRGNVHAVWNVYVGTRPQVLRGTRETQAPTGSETMDFGGENIGSWQVLSVTVKHQDANPQDFECTVDVENV